MKTSVTIHPVNLSLEFHCFTYI